MTGEMGCIDQDGYDPLNKERWVIHAAVAKAVHGELKPFDVYQGPYIQTAKGALWIQCDPKDELTGIVYRDGGARTRSGDALRRFFPAWSEQAAVEAAKRVLRA